MFIEYLSKNPRFFFAAVIAVVFSICLHELAHGLAAVRLGDRTPIETGHMTLNPLVHMGVHSILAMLIMGIAWGAMPVNERRLRGRLAPALVAAAGPAMNALLAIITLTSLGLWHRFAEFGGEVPDQVNNAWYLLWIFGYMNVVLLLFNLIPIPPLDGSRILMNFNQAYRNAILGIRSAGAIMLVAMLAAGYFISPVANRIAEAYLSLIQGY